MFSLLSTASWDSVTYGALGGTDTFFDPTTKTKNSKSIVTSAQKYDLEACWNMKILFCNIDVGDPSSPTHFGQKILRVILPWTSVLAQESSDEELSNFSVPGWSRLRPRCFECYEPVMN